MLIPVIKTTVIYRALYHCSCFLIDVTVIFTIERNVSVANGETLSVSLTLPQYDSFTASWRNNYAVNIFADAVGYVSPGQLVGVLAGPHSFTLNVPVQ